MVESYSYVGDHFPIVYKIGVSLPDALPRWNFNRADWVQFEHLSKDKLVLNTIELYEEPIVCVLFLMVVCQDLLQSRGNVVSPGLTHNVMMQ